MTNEAKRTVKALRRCPDSDFKCEQCPVYNPGFPCQNELNAADIIEELSEELERVKLERDAAIKDLSVYKECALCKYYMYNDNVYDIFGMCLGCGSRKNNFEWRGARE